LHGAFVATGAQPAALADKKNPPYQGKWRVAMVCCVGG